MRKGDTMAYTPDYSEGDLSASVIDVIVKIFIGVGVFAFLIVLVLLVNWARTRVRF